SSNRPSRRSTRSASSTCPPVSTSKSSCTEAGNGERRTQMLGLVGKKIGMTQRFIEGGNLVPVTVIETGPCTVVQVRTNETDGYDALQGGFGTRREKNLSKAVRGHMNKGGGRANFASLLEFRLREPGQYQIGQEIRLAD